MKTSTHHSGARVLLVHSDAPMSSVSIWFPTGSRHDSLGKEGIAHLMEHLLLRRTNEQPDRDAFLKGYAVYGIELNAYTAYETTHFQCVQPTEHTEKALGALLSAVTDGLIEADDLVSEKQIVHAEMAAEAQNPDAVMRTRAANGLWSAPGLSHPIGGTKETVASISLEDIKAYRRDRYVAENATVVVVGKMERSAVDTVLNKHFPIDGVHRPDPALAPQERVSEQRLDLQGDGELSRVSYNYLGVPQGNTKGRIAAELLVRILAGNWLSRLITDLRSEKHLTYWVQGSTANMRDTGYVRIEYSVKPAHLDLSLDVVRSHIKRITEEPVSATELADQKRLYLANIRKNGMNADENVWRYGYGACLTGECETEDEETSIVDNLTPQDILDIAKEIFQEDRSFLLIKG